VLNLIVRIFTFANAGADLSNIALAALLRAVPLGISGGL